MDRRLPIERFALLSPMGKLESVRVMQLFDYLQSMLHQENLWRELALKLGYDKPPC
ncbi:hypothetical protein D3C75_1283650 [compost metagenome]